MFMKQAALCPDPGQGQEQNCVHGPLASKQGFQHSPALYPFPGTVCPLPALLQGGPGPPNVGPPVHGHGWPSNQEEPIDIQARQSQSGPSLRAGANPGGLQRISCGVSQAGPVTFGDCVQGLAPSL